MENHKEGEGVAAKWNSAEKNIGVKCAPIWDLFWPFGYLN
ncbi:uncharacterized protein G2W53_039402 [Senna tora]|uniref:Uncharacterized protein n=1 Tax=Senna tora TaxID=362788 RepID=A0A834SPH0_9FABA|nr:uncharacterized protein G2W53_039402 [Senna tora]